MLNRSASLAMSTSVLKALPGKLDIKRHSPSILYISLNFEFILPRGTPLWKCHFYRGFKEENGTTHEMFFFTKFVRIYPIISIQNGLIVIDFIEEAYPPSIVLALKLFKPYKPNVTLEGQRQTVQSQIRRRKSRCLIRVSTVCSQIVLSKFE